MKAITLIFRLNTVVWVEMPSGKNKQAAFVRGAEISGVPMPYVVEDGDRPIEVLDLMDDQGRIILMLPWCRVTIKQDPVRAEP